MRHEQALLTRQLASAVMVGTLAITRVAFYRGGT
jgi:hypothetical protein